MVESAAHVLELSAPLEVISGRERHLPADFLLQLGDETAKVTVLNVHAYDDPAFTGIAIDLRRSVFDLDARDIFERKLHTVGGRQQKPADVLHTVAQLRG